ncbi:lytic murein transglycosylase [Nocardioides litoris]|uniref:lytic murein transglycosylase n=1 Tax=Nocardioides litoris TaxID=1926648 RepID=UPI001FE83239|nr:lytic murein transglycosylase [Nocardioides litoris]
MTGGRPLRSAVLFLLALAAAAAVVFWLQQTLYLRPPADDLTPADGVAAVGAPATRPVRTGGDGAAGAAAPGVPQVDPAWLRRTARAAGLDPTALAAYARAELAAPTGCGLGWTTLAGIGWVESHHGTIGGRTLGADGRPSSEVLGPALDGRGPVAAIPATPATTAYHGDPRWDHAVGPMQFIPTTWETWGADGDGDGDADPHDLDDAALAAARYLCAGGRDLTTGRGWTDAVLSYNRSRAYLDAVHLAATTYAGRPG